MNKTEKNKKTVMLYYNEAWNNRNYEIINQTHHKNWIHHDSSNPHDLEGGAETNILALKELVKAFPDVNIKIEDIIGENDKVVVRFLVTGTHLGQFGSLSPTKKQINLEGYVTHRLVDGKIIEDWAVRDTYGLLIQLGVIDPGN